ncbi:helix-turn-helix transcriptional regulator [Priestia endophytica]|jgi:putative transcriptional regulator|uniref:helix-turn-helix transcriptional regulator n=1 Tax=Priestia endophytica TaxID=135735 RepID=UPI00203A6D96|nr:helix-turn-helix transcriptional regulator [Priestia endophytica]MCM3538055.1 helix-turn-helix transcriptional regulator [Priestia endophytica]
MKKDEGVLHNKLHVLRAERKWTQKEVAEKIQVSRQTIVSIEANKYNPSLILSFKLAQLFGVRIEEIFQYSEGMTDDE